MTKISFVPKPFLVVAKTHVILIGKPLSTASVHLEFGLDFSWKVGFCQV